MQDGTLQGTRLPACLPPRLLIIKWPTPLVRSLLHSLRPRPWLQVGAFPFDHIDNPDPNSPAAHEEVYKQQTGEKWSEVPHIAKAVEKVLAREGVVLSSHPAAACTRSLHVHHIPAHLLHVPPAVLTAMCWLRTPSLVSPSGFML